MDKLTFDTGAAIEFDIGLPPTYIGHVDYALLCESCEVNEGIEHYDNQCWGPSGWMCGECISQAEMEL